MFSSAPFGDLLVISAPSRFSTNISALLLVTAQLWSSAHRQAVYPLKIQRSLWRSLSFGRQRAASSSNSFYLSHVSFGESTTSTLAFCHMSTPKKFKYYPDPIISTRSDGLEPNHLKSGKTVHPISNQPTHQPDLAGLKSCLAH
jgi:hypothetical protein